MTRGSYRGDRIRATGLKQPPILMRCNRKGQRSRAPVTIFISHVHEEAAIACVMRTWLHATFPGLVRVFASSDYQDIPLGTRWLDVIDASLNDSRLLVTLLSPRSYRRMWIHLEAGWALGRHIGILPVCHSGARISQLPRPYSDYFGTEVESGDFAERLLTALKRHLGLHHALPKRMLVGLASDIKHACDRVGMRE